MTWPRRLAGALLGLALAVGAGAPARAARLQPVTLMLDWYPNADHAGVFVGLDQGDFARHGLALRTALPPTSTAPLELVARGQVPFAISYEPDTLVAVAQGLPVRAVFALVPAPLNCLITLASTGITRPRQLMGRLVGTSGLAEDDAFLDAMVRADHGDPRRVRLVDVGFNLVPALLGHRVDAIVGGYWNWEAVEIAQAGYPVRVLRLQDWGVPTYDELVVVTSDRLAAQDPGLVRAFVAALRQGLEQAAADPDLAVRDVLAANRSLSPALVRRSVALLTPLWRAPGGASGSMSPAAWQAFADWMWREHLLPRRVAASQAMTDAFLPGSAGTRSAA